MTKLPPLAKTCNVALYDLWRFKDGKAGEHSDNDTRDDVPISESRFPLD